MFSAIHGDSLDKPARDDDASGTSLVQVVELARGGDSQAFSALFQQYNSQICVYLARLVGNDEVGHDLAQETFLHAWQSLVLALNGTVYVSVGNSLYALNATNGKQLWVLAEQSPLSSPVTG